jgi:hypothetical protein
MKENQKIKFKSQQDIMRHDSFPETEAISLHYDSQHGMNIHNPNSVPNNWSAGCTVVDGKSPAGVILEEAGKIFNQKTLLERMLEIQKSAEPLDGRLGGDVGGAEPPTLTVTANDMADELEALPQSMREIMEAEEIIGELRRQGDEVAVTIDNPRYNKFEWNLMSDMKNQQVGIQYIDPVVKKQMDDYQYAREHNLMFGGVDPVNHGNADSVVAMGMAMMSQTKLMKPEEQQSNINQIK